MKLAEALRAQAENNASLASPFTARLLRLLGERLTPGTPLTDRLIGWPGDIGPSGDSVPLRLLGGLHALVLSKRAPGLAACFPPHPEPGDEALWRASEEAMRTQEPFLLRWLDSPPQTNEVRRAGVLIAAGHLLTACYGLPIVLSELGASGGLNLMWDRYALSIAGQTYGPPDSPLRLTPDWQGAPPPVARPQVSDRRGVDLNPLDAHNEADALRLMAYLWADQPERLARTRVAMALADAQVDRGDAASWLAQRLSRPRPGALHMVFHTIAWQYFPPETQAGCDAALSEAGARASASAPLAHLSMEADGGHGAALVLQCWPGGTREALGRADFHGRWVDWRAK